MGEDLATLAREFRQLGNWMSSPLYQSLGQVVAEDPGMLEVISRRRPGQVPVSVFFAAVHYLLLSGVEHELSEFYPSIVWKDARGPDDAGPALRDFFLRHQPEIDHLVSTGLVQKHVVKRSAVL